MAPTNPLEKVKPGDQLEIRADTWNTFVEAAQHYLENKLPVSTSDPSQRLRPRLILPVRNDSGVDRNRGDVLEISDVFPQPADNLDAFHENPGLRGIIPSGDPTKTVATLLEPAASGAHARAILSGVAAGRVYVATTAEQNAKRFIFARAKNGDATQYQLAPFGPHRVLWLETGTGTRKALILHGAPGDDGVVICTSTAQIPAATSSAPGTATVQPQRIDPSTGQFTDDGPTETLYSWTSNPSQAPPGGGTIRVIAHRDYYGRLIWTGEDCP